MTQLPKGTSATAPPCAPAGEVRLCRRGHGMHRVASSGKFCCPVCRALRRKVAYEPMRQRRLEARRKRIAERRRPSTSDRNWAAGHFEGEGSLMIVGSKDGRPSRPCVCLTSTDRSMVEFFRDRWSGFLVSFLPKSPGNRAREAFRWELSSLDPIECFLLDMLPHLRSARVREKAELLLEDVRERAEQRRTPEARRRQSERRARMRELNRRGCDGE